ncbi:hypothetical protein [Solicola sp. PLA-1-18]|uniref:hypothetical protein n=1 Tax=Solicola sp. PLA-1-18 TaxID=3380532 RepID=UPI003B76225D
MTLLIDSNVFIAVEDHSTSSHVNGPAAAELHRLAARLGHRIVISHGTRSDLLRAPDPLKGQRQRALDRYLVLSPVKDDPVLAAQFPAVRGPNDQADLEVGSAFATGVAHWLVTEDAKLRGRLQRAGHSDVFALTEAIEALNSQLATPTALPTVETVDAYELDSHADIFTTLKADYDGFTHWWRTKVCAGNRKAIILGTAGAPQGLCVPKLEHDRPHGLEGTVLKLCTFKVSDGFRGVARGELLLQAAIETARQHSVGTLYLEVLPDKEDLIVWLARFGFEVRPGHSTPRGEAVYVKHLIPPADRAPRHPLEHAIAHGPGHVLVHRPTAVPIQPTWHRQLFPQADQQGDLFTGLDACGNAIRKVYVCQSPTRYLDPGDTLLFVLTGTGDTRVTAIGVVEETLVTADAGQMLGFTASRSVYSADQIRQWCKVETLAIRFRLDRVLNEQWPLAELEEHGLLKSSPQSITRLKDGATAWVNDRLAESL